MVTVDYLILGIIAASILIGYFRGFFPELIAILTWVAALFGGWQFSGLVEPYLAGKLGSVVAETWAARLIVFVTILVVGGLLGQVIALIIDKTGLSGTDRLLGLVFGLVRGAVIVGVLVIFAQLLGLPKETWWAKSKLIPFGETMASVIRGALPDSISQHLVPKDDEDAVEPPGAALGG